MFPRGIPHQKVLDHLCLQKKLVFHFIVVLGAVGLTQVATTRSHIEQSLSIPRKKFSKWQWFLECSPEAFPNKNVLDQLWLPKKLVFHFIVVLGAVGLTQVATTRSHIEQFPLSPRKNISKWQWFLECSSGAFPTRKVLDQLWLQKRLFFHCKKVVSESNLPHCKTSIHSKVNSQPSTAPGSLYSIKTSVLYKMPSIVIYSL